VKEFIDSFTDQHVMRDGVAGRIARWIPNGFYDDLSGAIGKESPAVRNLNPAAGKSHIFLGREWTHKRVSV
jgi:hypothetical protein